MTERWIHDSVCCMSDSNMPRVYMIAYRLMYGLS